MAAVRRLYSATAPSRSYSSARSAWNFTTSASTSTTVPRTIIGLASLDIRAGADLASKDHGTTPYRGTPPQAGPRRRAVRCLPLLRVPDQPLRDARDHQAPPCV